ncbi:hypothetical protein C8J56DRAFT_849017 [Mycena floridula]|nr:hypothetical protein C8J56DRAFT_849017 [Mycena floridula]
MVVNYRLSLTVLPCCFWPLYRVNSLHRDILPYSSNGSWSQWSRKNGLVENPLCADQASSTPALPSSSDSQYATIFLTQLQYFSGRERKILRGDNMLFFVHVTAVAAVLGVFCGGLYFNTGLLIAGFQSCVRRLLSLVQLPFSSDSLSTLYNVAEICPLFLRKRSYYSQTSWLVSRFIFDVVLLWIILSIIISTIALPNGFCRLFCAS